MPPGTRIRRSLLEHLIDRAPDVQQHRQIGVAGDLQLLDEEMLLARDIDARQRRNRGRSRRPPPADPARLPSPAARTRKASRSLSPASLHVKRMNAVSRGARA
jgi:hypothetical protein